MLINQNYFFSTRDELEPNVTFNGYLKKSAECCRYLGIRLDSKLTFEAHLIVVQKNGGRHSLTISGEKSYTFGSKAASFQIFSPVSFVIQWSLFTNIVNKSIQRINRQINWGIKVCYKRRKFDHCRNILLQWHVLPTELIASKFSILKLHTDLNQRIVSETFKKCANRLQLKQNKRLKQLIIRSQNCTQQSKGSFILKIIQK